MKRVAFCVLFFTMLFNFSVPSHSYGKEKEAARLEWLKLSKGVVGNWKTTISTTEPSMMDITPKWNRRKTDVNKRILVILPKSSESYSLATSVFLEILHREGFYAHITLVNYNKEETRGLAALEFAKNVSADLIFSIGSESQTFLHKHYNNGEISVVTCTSKDPVQLGFIKDYEHGSGTNIAYTSLNIPLDIQLAYLLRLNPKLKNIGLMYDRSHAEVMATEVLPAQKLFRKMGFNVTDVTVEADEKQAKKLLAVRMPEAIMEMKKRDPLLENSMFWITSSTSIFSNMAFIKDYADKIPVIASIPNVVTQGKNSAALAIGIDRRNNAHLASIYAVRILRGETKAGDLKVGIVTPPDIAINFYIARKIGLKIPFDFFESAAFIYDYKGMAVRAFGEKVPEKDRSAFLLEASRP
jgi:putative ABC transport system substrate-binding protein